MDKVDTNQYVISGDLLRYLQRLRENLGSDERFGIKTRRIFCKRMDLGIENAISFNEALELQNEREK